MDRGGKKIKCNSRRNSRKDKERECCMCGDVGFQEHLFRCKRCYHRFQHIYCSRLYSDQLELGSVNVCEWCLDMQERKQIRSHKRKAKLKKMGRCVKAKKLADSEIVSRLASTNSMEQPASVGTEKTRKSNAKPTSLKLRLKYGGSKQNQPSSYIPEDCKLFTESHRNIPRTSVRSNNSKGGLGRRYKLLSDVLCL